MQVTLFTRPKAIVTLVFAAVFLLDANLILNYFGIDLNGGGILVARVCSTNSLTSEPTSIK